MIVIYKTLTAKELKSGARDAIVQITEFFKKNPDRTNCVAQMFYGRNLDVKPGTVAQQVNAFVKELIAEDKAKAKAKK
jgi:hypothetical protein